MKYLLSVFLLTYASFVLAIGQEVSVKERLSDGDEFNVSVYDLVQYGQQLFNANWTNQEGGGRPLTKGVGAPLSDPTSPLVFPNNFNRVSAPEANSCAGCHNLPRSGGGGDIVANVFVLGHRFDNATFDHSDTVPLKGALDESGNFPTLNQIANSRNTLGMFGSGYIDMLSRQMTKDLQDIRDLLQPGDELELVSKGVSFGFLSRDNVGNWNVSDVEGLLFASISTIGPDDPPTLQIKPFHQVGGETLRGFTVNAFNHHHGMQASERFGAGVDADGDGFADELTITDITATSVFQAQLAVPGRVIPNDSEIEAAVRNGEEQFIAMGCSGCHIPALPLVDNGHIYTEPNPYNKAGDLQPGDRDIYRVDLNDKGLGLPRLKEKGGVTMVPAFTDLKLHNITSGPNDPNCEHLNQTGEDLFEGNCTFLTKKLWGIANEPPYFHHGKFVTMREAIEAHRGDALEEYQAWAAASKYDQDSVIEFLKTLQVLPKGTRHLVVDENGRPKRWDSAFAFDDKKHWGRKHNRGRWR